MTARLRRILAQAGSFVLAGVLLYFALRGVDFGSVWEALREADYRWLLPMVVVTLLSHLGRAWRWQMLLEALPVGAGAAPARVSLKTAFYSVMIGYMVNYAAPRLGEVARTANLSAREKMPFSAVLGTVVVERVLDVAVLAAALVSVGILLLERLGEVRRLFVDPLVEQAGHIPVLALAGLALGVAGLVGLIFYHLARRENTAVQAFWTGRVRPILASFRDGLLSVIRSRRRAGLVVSTLGIWACYLLMAYLPFQMFGMVDAFGLTLVDAWSIMNLGAIGMAIPSPGGTGSYHFITIQTLERFFAVPGAAAATYAVFSHGAQLVLYTVAGSICLLLQGSSFSALRARTAAARQEG